MAQPNKQPPVEFRGMTGNDTFSIHTPQGSKWAKVGQSVGGYLISGYDTKTQNLQITQSGRHYTIPMGGSIITEYKPPSATIERPYTVDPTEMIPLERPIAKDAVVGAGATSNWEQEFVNSQHYKFKPEEVDKIIENSKKSSYMTEEQKKNIMSLEAYHKNIAEKKILPDTDYYIPKRSDDGSVDFDIFKYKPQGEIQ
jgi:hypothetical protein